MNPLNRVPSYATYRGPLITARPARKKATLLASFPGPNAASCNGLVTNARANIVAVSVSIEGVKGSIRISEALVSIGGTA